MKNVKCIFKKFLGVILASIALFSCAACKNCSVGRFACTFLAISSSNIAFFNLKSSKANHN